MSRVTSAGQLTIPKKIRQRLGLRGASFVVLDEAENVILLRPFEADEETLKILRRKFKKTGLTKAHVSAIVERERTKHWKETTHDIR